MLIYKGDKDNKTYVAIARWDSDLYGHETMLDIRETEDRLKKIANRHFKTKMDNLEVCLGKSVVPDYIELDIWKGTKVEDRKTHIRKKCTDGCTVEPYWANVYVIYKK